MFIRWRLKRVAALVSILTVIILIACGQGGSMIIPNANQQPDPGQPTADIPTQGVEQPVNDDQSRNVLSIDLPTTGTLSIGDTFEVSVKGDFHDEVYQGSMRILFDPTAFKPIKAQRGAMLEDQMLHLANLDKLGFVPFSFTALPGNPSMKTGSGELIRLQFEVVGNPDGAQRIRFRNDQEFLQIRDRNCMRLPFDLETRQGVTRQ